MKKSPLIVPVRKLWYGLLVTLIVVPQCANALTVAAANSSCELLEKIGALYSAKYGSTVEFICKSSGLLANGLMGKSLQADVYLSASEEWMEKMEQAGEMKAGTVRALWGNSIVIAAPQHSKLKVTKLEDITSDEIKRVISGDPSTMPLGRHAKEALEASGLWQQVREKIETKKHITLVAEELVQADDSTVGFLFKTNLSPGLRILHIVDPSLHEPVRYFVGCLANAREPEQANKFVEFMRSDEAGSVIEKAGFTVIAK